MFCSYQGIQAVSSAEVKFDNMDITYKSLTELLGIHISKYMK
jgi:hypothetical protein